MQRIFISYTTADSEIAAKLAAALDEAGFSPWIDQREIRPGDSFVEKMNEGLADASYMLLLLSERSIKSHFVTLEWTSALASRATVLIPVLLDDTRPPPLLSGILHFDLRDEPATGLANIVDFFKQEVHCDIPRRRGGTERPPSLRHASRRQLRLVATRCVKEPEIETFCFEAHLDPGRLRGNSLQERLLSLLHYVTDDGIIERFAEWLELERSACVQFSLKQLVGTESWNWTVQSNARP